MMATASIHLLRTHKMNLLGRVVGCARYAGIDAELLCLVEQSLQRASSYGQKIGTAEEPVLDRAIELAGAQS
jgi:hypothetical protein